jgi:uncharacterized protein (DUF488 family)
MDTFGSMLTLYAIQFIVDVRSVPFSSREPQFNKNSLAGWLPNFGIKYAHMPNEFGARRDDPALLDFEGRVDFDRVRSSKVFRRGIQRVEAAASKGYRLALMCAEADPFDCHRFAMISYQLVRDGFEVKHILKDGTLVDNAYLEHRLAQLYCISLQGDIFLSSMTKESCLEEAYRLRGREVAFSPSVQK